MSGDDDPVSMELATLILTIGLFISCCFTCGCCLTFFCAEEAPSTRRFRREILKARSEAAAAKRYQVDSPREGGGEGGDRDRVGNSLAIDTTNLSGNSGTSSGSEVLTPSHMKTVDEDDEPGSYSTSRIDMSTHRSSHRSSSDNGVNGRDNTVIDIRGDEGEHGNNRAVSSSSSAGSRGKIEGIEKGESRERKRSYTGIVPGAGSGGFGGSSSSSYCSSAGNATGPLGADDLELQNITGFGNSKKLLKTLAV